MSVGSVIAALEIPPGAVVDQRVPKKLLVEQGAPSTADRRKIMDGIEELHWVAALKPATIGVPAFRDASREYLEVSVLTVALRATAKAPRLVELIHRAIPYPLLLVSSQGGAIAISMAHKRWSQGEAGRVVVEAVQQVSLDTETPAAADAAFLESLAVSRLPARDLFALYGGWLGRLAALEVARITGVFRLPESAERAAAVRDGLERHARLQRDIGSLRARAGKESQMNRRVELNSAIKRLEAELAATRNIL